MLDYADMEHFALRALSDGAVRGMYTDTYRHVFVDEYQDTNPVQEEIVRAVSGGGSLFMVGDIKQSIYKFRLADPMIFREKAQEFRTGAASGELILMNDNFRSRRGVIDAVNGIMERVMCEELGEVCYDENERLRGSTAGGRRVFCCAREQTENVPGTGIANRQGYLLRKLHASFPERSQINKRANKGPWPAAISRCCSARAASLFTS